MRKSIRYILILLSVCLMNITTSNAADAAWQGQTTQELTLFRADRAVSDGPFAIDLTCVPKGLIAVSCRSEKKLHVLVNYLDSKSNYVVPNDGTPYVIPLPYGNGVYTVSIWEYYNEDGYVKKYETNINAVLDDPLSPFSYANGRVPYKENDTCVKLAHKIAKKAISSEMFAYGVKEWTEKNVVYDTSYVPGKLSTHQINPDETIRSGKGICLDYASLMAAMLRSQGVPARLAFGYVTHEGVREYHAWTDAWIDGAWVTLDPLMPEEIRPVYEPTQYF